MIKSSDSRFGFYISIINRAAQAYFHRELRAFNIGPGQQAYLLSLYPGETIVQDELTRRLRVDKANVTRALKGLEKQGYVSRVRSSEDRRAWEISLTKNGLKTRAKVESISKKWIGTLKKPLSEREWNTLQEYLRRIAESIQLAE